MLLTMQVASGVPSTPPTSNTCTNFCCKDKEASLRVHSSLRMNLRHPSWDLIVLNRRAPKIDRAHAQQLQDGRSNKTTTEARTDDWHLRRQRTGSMPAEDGRRCMDRHINQRLHSVKAHHLYFIPLLKPGTSTASGNHKAGTLSATATVELCTTTLWASNDRNNNKNKNNDW